MIAERLRIITLNLNTEQIDADILADLVFPAMPGRVPESVKVVRLIPLDLIETGDHVPGMKLAEA